MASLVTVAPETVSTARLWFSTIAAGMFSMAPSLIPAVSECSTTFTESMALAEKVTSTFTSPFLPAAVPV